MADRRQELHDEDCDEDYDEDGTIMPGEACEEGVEFNQQVMEEKNPSIWQRIAQILQLLLASLLYCYVLVVMVLRYVFPASLAPLLQHWADEVPSQPKRNASNPEGKSWG